MAVAPQGVRQSAPDSVTQQPRQPHSPHATSQLLNFVVKQLALQALLLVLDAHALLRLDSR